MTISKTDEQVVKEKLPDAEIFIALNSSGAFAVRSNSLGVTISAMKFTRDGAWADARRRIEQEQP